MNSQLLRSQRINLLFTFSLLRSNLLDFSFISLFNSTLLGNFLKIFSYFSFFLTAQLFKIFRFFFPFSFSIDIKSRWHFSSYVRSKLLFTGNIRYLTFCKIFGPTMFQGFTDYQNTCSICVNMHWENTCKRPP